MGILVAVVLICGKILLKDNFVMENPNTKLFKAYWPLAGLILLYLITRLYALTFVPIGSLEAAWIHWAQIIVRYPGELLIAGDSGQQPLFTWLIAVTLNIFTDPLMAGRFVSVLAGLTSMVGLYFIGRDLVNRTVGVLAGLVYIVLPYVLFFDRHALPGGLLLAFGIWMFRWSLHIAQEPKPNTNAFKILGILTGAALLTDLRALFLFSFVAVVFFFWKVYQRSEFWKQLGVSLGILLAMNLPVLFSASYPETPRLRYGVETDSKIGIRQAAQFLKKEAEAFRQKTGVPLPVLLPMTPGNPAEGITVYLWNHPDVRFVPVFWWPKSPKLIPSGLRFSHRPSIYQTSPVMRRETTLLDYAHFIFPGSGYSHQKFLQENPRFRIAWSFHRDSQKLNKGNIVIYKNIPKK